MQFLSLLKSPRVLISFLYALLVVMVFTMSGQFGLTGMQRWLVIVALTLLFGLAQLLLGLRKKKKANDQLEKSLVIEAESHAAEASDEEKQRRESARRELMEAIEALKHSPVGGGGKAALRALPWYLVLGREGSGKSGLIHNSGLQLPGQKAGELKGIGASRYCDWWFTSQGLLMEAKGRFLSAAPAEAERDWRAFLQTLRKVRPAVALQGVVLTLGVDELRSLQGAELTAYAAQLRQRLDRLGEYLQLECPIYLMLTKLDLLHGFAASFEAMDAAHAGQVWGATLPLRGQENLGAGERVLREFDLLYQSLCERRVPQLTLEANPERRADIYLFPLELRGLRERLGAFADALFAPDTLGRRPLLRGLYLSSAAQEGRAVETVLTEVSRVVGLGTSSDLSGTEVPRGRAQNSRPYFIRSFFLRALIPDFRLARPTRRFAARLRLRRLSLKAAGFALLGLFGLLIIVSFGRNLALISRTTALTESARQVTVNEDPEARDVESALQRLDDLRGLLQRLDLSDRRRSPALGLGFYRGHVVNNRAREIYVDRLFQALLAPSRTRFAEHLRLDYPDDNEGYQDFADRYRAYRMLIDPEQGNADELVPALQTLWAGAEGRGASDRLLSLIDSHLRYAWSHVGDLEARSASLPGADPRLVARANDYIRDFWQPDRFYELMVAAADESVPVFRPSAVPGGDEAFAPDPEALAAGGSDHVSGAYTLAGWREVIKGRILASDQQLAEDWLLREAFGERTTSIQPMLLKLYVDDYIAAWASFFRGVDVARTANLQSAAQQLDRLGDKDSPFRLLLEEAAQQLRLRDDALGENSGLGRIEASWTPLMALFEKSKDGDEEGKPMELFLADFKAVAGELERLRDAENPAAAAGEFTRGLMQASGPGQDESAINKAMQRARRHVNRHEGEGLPACNEALGEFLKRPARSAWRACLAETARYLDVAWKERVWNPYNETLNRRYPFFPTGPDASLDDFGLFFGPSGIIAEFGQQELAAYRSETGEPILRHGVGLELAADAQEALNKAQRYREALFRGGGDKPSFRFELTPGRPRLISGRDPVVEATRLTLDNNRLLYEMGHATTREFTWPGEGERLEASLALRCSAAGPEPLRIEDSAWGLFRLLDRARVEPVDSRRFHLIWTLEKSGDHRLEVPYELRAASAVNPLTPGFFDFRCPARLSP